MNQHNSLFKKFVSTMFIAMAVPQAAMSSDLYTTPLADPNLCVRQFEQASSLTLSDSQSSEEYQKVKDEILRKTPAPRKFQIESVGGYLLLTVDILEKTQLSGLQKLEIFEDFKSRMFKATKWKATTYASQDQFALFVGTNFHFFALDLQSGKFYRGLFGDERFPELNQAWHKNFRDPFRIGQGFKNSFSVLESARAIQKLEAYLEDETIDIKDFPSNQDIRNILRELKRTKLSNTLFESLKRWKAHISKLLGTGIPEDFKELLQ